MKLIDAKIVENYGDKKFLKIYNNSTRKTPILGLNLFPVKINWEDYKIILREILCFLEAGENTDRSLLYISQEFVISRTGYVRFVDFARRITEECKSFME
jgi:hypothetical protein